MASTCRCPTFLSKATSGLLLPSLRIRGKSAVPTAGLSSHSLPQGLLRTSTIHREAFAVPRTLRSLRPFSTTIYPRSATGAPPPPPPSSPGPTARAATATATHFPQGAHSHYSHPRNPRLAARQAQAHNTQSTLYYTGAIIVFFIGASYAAVPLYKLICTDTGLDGTPMVSPGHKFEPESMIPLANAQKLKIKFASSVSDHMRWSFTPVSPEIHVVPGETALAFYTAHNPTEEDIVGISTYSVVPAKAAQYFNKIQCFCFEEQKLEAGEEVDMPVFFYIDPEFAYDPWMKDVKTITLHYTFFRSKAQ
ncbi:cytochrome c oxidase assembly protein CtaG/Cox11-domain-containing protein [Fimicolochytrium jonesii]|uniref:cytochrome c oxidase assembly protein CtaG/Cox11-domain-containing protein n=1 Tax=Fimicolochytrium jonesii TaxID=1396493 RepID=UPI0022FEE375|nr:cytochrome c oxidase assembly protein CtaG/Cox11-domain-containing protein [Fimicolochytrium jonesii]KAI8826198.1 cytochrome c oxidase assembly protein CtaG/Cox11-domain-containing protein [Fimicolochytrium jonesii]